MAEREGAVRRAGACATTPGCRHRHRPAAGWVGDRRRAAPPTPTTACSGYSTPHTYHIEHTFGWILEYPLAPPHGPNGGIRRRPVRPKARASAPARPLGDVRTAGPAGG